MYKILIRPLAIEDADISWKWRNDPEVWAQTGNSPDKPITLDIETEWIKKVIKDEATKRFAITVDNQYVGNVQLTDVTDSEGQFHVFIGEKSFWGKGVASQATYQILNYAKEILKLTEVYLYVKKSNESAIKVYKKNSFIIEEEQDVDKIKMTCKLSDLPLPMVSIFCMVYNHEKYISDAIEGFLMQKNNFSSIIVIGEDCSTDGSRNIINSYVEKFPGKFKLIYHDLNIGAHKNQEIILKNCNGKYVAMCEGDDYWTDPLKLQKQVDFLEANSEFGLCHTNSSRFTQDTQKSIDDCTIQVSCTDVFSRLIKAEYPISTLTTVFHKKIWEQYIVAINPAGKGWLMGDLPFWLYLSRDYKVHYHDDITAVYRVTEESASNTRDLNKMIRFDKSVKEVKLFFLEKYADDFTDMSKIKREVEAIYIYRKIIAFAKCNGNLNIFFYLLFQFHKINREPRHFLGSFKQIVVRLF